MGNLCEKNNQNKNSIINNERQNARCVNNVSNDDLLDFINKIKYLENAKQTTNDELLIQIYRNTDWNKINWQNANNICVAPSAPPLEDDISVAIAVPIAIKNVAQMCPKTG